MDNVLVDGLPISQIPVDDRGLAYGDGVFETLVVERGVPVRLDRHLNRLIRGCDRLGIEVAHLRAILVSEALQLSQSAAESCAVLKIMVTRGSAGRGYATDPLAPPRRILRLIPQPRYPVDYCGSGIRLGLCKTRLALNPRLAGIKHLNRLEQVLARQELAADEQEGVVLDMESYVVEGTFSNLFFVHDNQLITPMIDRCGVAGIAREVVFDVAKQQGVVVREQRVSVDDLLQADAIIATNSVISAWPVRAFQGRHYDSHAWAQRVRDWLKETN